MTNTEPNTARKPRRMARPPEAGLPRATPANDAGGISINGGGPDAPQQVTKSSIVLDLLRCEQGALLADIVAATGWLPHTARAALTGLRKQGHAITSTKVDKVTCYKLA